MNYKKWQRKAKTDRLSYSEAFLKLVEEVGEVGKAMNEQTDSELLEEIGHVIFIAQCFETAIVRRQLHAEARKDHTHA